jgi:hypothetical protein
MKAIKATGFLLATLAPLVIRLSQVGFYEMIIN